VALFARAASGAAARECLEDLRGLREAPGALLREDEAVVGEHVELPVLA
jgi:hypothetical protein